MQRAQPRRGGRTLFNSFDGQFSDSPRAIYEELMRRDPSRPVAFVSSGDAGLPAGVPGVAMHSWPFIRELGRAEHVVSNVGLPPNFVPPAGVTYLQTWHGTPLKRIGSDNPRWQANPEGLKAFESEVARWTHLVSPNRFTSEVFATAFPSFAGELLETGYPRNDALSAPDREQVRARVREALRVPDGATAVLYAPTWRDDLVTDDGGHEFRLELDLPLLRDRLGDGHVLLARLHYVVTSGLEGVDRPWIRDVSGHPDIRELYLAADVLVTDYSSTMFDFAATGKPIALFTPDLERYRDDLRGFYFDLEAEAPGPVCRTSEELAAALDGLAAGARLARFRERFCHLDDGGAAARVVDAVFGGR